MKTDKTTSWDNRYSQEAYVYGEEANVFLQEKISLLETIDDVLCIAEGEGRNAVFLAEANKTVTAWDYSNEGLKKARKLAEKKQVTIKTEQVDLVHVEWEANQWDAVVNIHGHFNPQDRQTILQGVQTTIKPQGYYISEVYSTDQLRFKTGGPKNIAMLYDPIELLELFKDWRIIHFFVGETVRNEGAMHHGAGHVIQMMFQKI